MFQETDKAEEIISAELKEEFERDALPHMAALKNFALKMTNDPDLADDLVQETFIKAYRFFDRFEKGTNIKAWLYRIMKNSFINQFRKDNKTPEKIDYDDVENFYENIKSEAQNSNDLDKDIFSNVFDDEISQALNSLSDEFKTVILLCDIEGYTYEEVAEFLDCPVGTVRSRLHRARNMLAELLEDYAKEKGYV